jgi:hypothetical protein
MPVIINGTNGVNIASTTGVINLLGSTSGTLTLQANATAGTNTITLPASTGTVALTSALPSSSQLCQAWGSYNFTSTTTVPTLRGSYNISSITRNSQGNYTLAFTNSLANTNYACVANASQGPDTYSFFAETTTKNTNNAVIQTGYTSSAGGAFTNLDYGFDFVIFI